MKARRPPPSPRLSRYLHIYVIADSAAHASSDARRWVSQNEGTGRAEGAPPVLLRHAFAQALARAAKYGG